MNEILTALAKDLGVLGKAQEAAGTDQAGFPPASTL